MNDWSTKIDNLMHCGASDAVRNAKLRRVCKEFESIFTYEILKSMRRTVEKGDLFHGGQGEEIYESLLDQELAKSIAGKGPHSLAEQLYRQLKRAEGAENREGGKPSAVQCPVPDPKAFRKDP
jgi:Rod binding domain-containing protein